MPGKIGPSSNMTWHWSLGVVIHSEDQEGARQSFPAFSGKASKQKTQEKESLHVLSAVQETGKEFIFPRICKDLHLDWLWKEHRELYVSHGNAMEMAKTTGKRLGCLKYPSLEHPRQLNTLLPTHMGHLSPELSGNLTTLRFIMYIHTYIYTRKYPYTVHKPRHSTPSFPALLVNLHVWSNKNILNTQIKM